jgi:N-acetyl-anhydromuramyl-L-alanine amidase AmpD
MDKSIWIGSTNFSKGRYIYKPEYIVIHIMQGSLIGTDSWFNNPSSHVSAHSGVGSNGDVHDYVHSTDTAWHCGVFNTNGATFPNFKYTAEGKLVSPNLYTLGIEHEGTNDKEITEACYLASARKIKYWSERYNIPIDEEHLVTHQSIYPGHICPHNGVNIPKLIQFALQAVAIQPV